MNSDPSPIASESLLAHAAWVRRLARCLVADPATADDLVQQTWLVALLRPPRHAERLRGWLGSVVRSLARKDVRGRDRRQRREALATPPSSAADPPVALAKAELERRVVAAVRSLAPIYRAAIEQRFVEGRSVAEISRAFALPAETVRTRVKRGLDQLRERLARELGDDVHDWRGALAPLLIEGGRVWLLRGAVAAAALLTAAAWIVARSPTEHDGAQLAALAESASVRRGGASATSDDPTSRTEDRQGAIAHADEIPIERRSEALRLPAVSGWVAPWWRTTGAERIGSAIVLAAPWGASEWLPLDSYVARVRALAAGDDAALGEVRRVLTDDTGRFEFEELDPATRWSFVAVDPALGLGGPMEIAVAAGSAVTQVELYAQRSQVFEGVVRGDDGEPVAGARLEVAPSLAGPSMSWAGLPLSLEASGRFVVELPAYRWVRFKATAPGRMEARCSIQAREATLHPQPVELRLLPARRLEGSFVARDGSPFPLDEGLVGRLAAAESTLDSLDGVAVVSLDRDFDFRVGVIVAEGVESVGQIDLPRNSFTVDVSSETPRVALVARHTIVGWIERERNGNLRGEPNGADLLVDGRLLPSIVGDASLRVRVVDERGRPLPCPPEALELLDLHVNPAPLLDVRDEAAADRGVVIWPSLPLGRWSVGARVEGRLAAAQLVPLERDGEVYDVELRLPQPTATLRCTVVDAAGKPLDAARRRSKSNELEDPLEPRLYRSTDGGWQPAEWLPDETAGPSSTSATLRVLPGRYAVVVRPPRLADGERYGPAWSVVDVLGTRAEVKVESRATERFPLDVIALPEVELPPEPIGLQLRVLTLDGIPLVDDAGPDSQRGLLGTKVRTALPAGRYRVIVHLPRHEPAEQVVDVPADRQVELPLRFTSR
ncbi:MAG: RNA polymerase sigma factor [Planctomycetes bacterium]|nr:RNA polymerase sigma factor [Planctomycetota bacterium]